MRRAARPSPAPGAVGEVPGCLLQRGVREVWGADALAGPRWAAAADRWRAAAAEASLSTARVWQLLPDGAHRFSRSTDEDVAHLADQARALYPDLFTTAWSSTTSVPEAVWYLAQQR